MRHQSSVERVVVDTNVFVSALLSNESGPRHVIRLCLEKEIQPLMGNALFAEYESVLRRVSLLDRSPLSESERSELLDAFLSVCRWISIFYLWRPNLPDEADNHLIELGVAGNARWLITGNRKHFAKAELSLLGLQIATPNRFLQERKHQWPQ